jgi:ribosomal protein S18 acetylase RimI-like enzyme
VAAAAGVFARSLAEAWSESAIGAAREAGHGLLVVAEETGRAGSRWALAGAALALVQAGLAQVVLVAVDPAWRRRGIARAVLRRLEAEAIGRGATEAWLEVRAGNAAALALYRASGWTACGRRPRYYRDGEDAVLLSRDLGPPPLSDGPRRSPGSR